jgi:flagella basal body P-ring formation protein FlgA
MKRLQFSVCLALGLTVVIASDAFATVDVQLRERVEAASPVIRLGDVAQISSADRRKARQLSVLILMPAPAPGTERFLRQREIEDLLSAHGEDLADLRIDGAEQVQIMTPAAASPVGARESDGRSARSVNRHAAILAAYAEEKSDAPPAKNAAMDWSGEIQGIIRRHLESKTGQTGDWQIKCNLADHELAILQKASQTPTLQGGHEPWTGRQRFVLTVLTSDGSVNVPIYAEVSTPAIPVAVAIRPIARGSVITAADFELQNVGLALNAGTRRAPITSIEQLVGMEARQPIQAGEVVLNDKVRAPLLVKRGDLVTVLSHGGGIRVRTTARARQDGAKGELVQVESLETREQFDVRVTGRREAMVFAAASVMPTQPIGTKVETARR